MRYSFVAFMLCICITLGAMHHDKELKQGYCDQYEKFLRSMASARLCFNISTVLPSEKVYFLCMQQARQKALREIEEQLRTLIRLKQAIRDEKSAGLYGPQLAKFALYSTGEERVVGVQHKRLKECVGGSVPACHQLCDEYKKQLAEYYDAIDTSFFVFGNNCPRFKKRSFLPTCSKNGYSPLFNCTSS